MPTFGEAVGALEDELFVGRERELAEFEQWLTAERPTLELLNVSGRGGVGKSALLRAFARTAPRLGRPVVMVDGRAFPHTPRGLLQALLREEGHTRARARLRGGETEESDSALEARVVAYLNRARPLLLLDTFEELGELSRYLREALLSRLGTKVKVAIAGRYPLGLAWTEETSWRQIVRRLELGGLSAGESRDYLGRRGLAEPWLVEQVTRLAGGNPLALSLAADMALQLGSRDFATAPEWHLVVRSLVEQLLRDVKDARLRELLEACAVVRQFDEATLAAVSGQQDVAPAFRQLCLLSVVRSAEHGLMLHDDVRRVLAEDLRWRRPERYRELRLRALAHYRERMAVAPPEEREWLVAERFFLWENGLIQALFFADDEPGQVRVEAARPEDHDGILRIWMFWLNNIFAKQIEVEIDAAPNRADCEAILAYRGTRVRVVRDRDSRAIGFTTTLPVCQQSTPLLQAFGGPSIHALWPPLAALPATADSTSIFHFAQLAYLDAFHEPARAALLRDVFGVLALGQVYTLVTPIPEYKQLLEALGFQHIPAARSFTYGTSNPQEGYKLDLARIGFEPWIEAIMAGARPPAAAEPGESGSAGESLALAGATPLPPAWASEQALRAGFSAREWQVLAQLVTGVSNPAIADRLNISRHTAARHVVNIMDKLGVASRGEAVVRSLRIQR